jgi:molybdopterin molybdotransferase
MISVEEAFAAYPAALRPLPVEHLPIAHAAGRVLAEALASRVDLPRFDHSAMDGYALRAADTRDASQARPLRLPLAGASYAGAGLDQPALPSGHAARIFTGAPLPPGADSMIPQERVQREGDALLFTAPWPADRNIRRRGEELRAGTALAQAGQRITPGLLAALIDGGHERVPVHRCPRLRVVSTGDELRPAGCTLAPGQIPDSNGPLISAVLRRWGYAPAACERVPDDEAQVCGALERAFDAAEVVITSGGVSVGEHDFIRRAAQRLGIHQVFWQVAQRPGKPLYFGTLGDKLLLGLPGNPGAVLLGLCLHVRRALDVLEGAAQPGPVWHYGRLVQPVERDSKRARFVRMHLEYSADGTAQLHPLPHQDSHMLSNLAHAPVFVWVPSGARDAEAGSALRWTAPPA